MRDFKEFIRENRMLDNEYVYGIFLVRYGNVERGSSEYWSLKRIYEESGLYLKGNTPEEKRKFIKENGK